MFFAYWSVILLFSRFLVVLSTREKKKQTNPVATSVDWNDKYIATSLQNYVESASFSVEFSQMLAFDPKFLEKLDLCITACRTGTTNQQDAQHAVIIALRQVGKISPAWKFPELVKVLVFVSEGKRDSFSLFQIGHIAGEVCRRIRFHLVLKLFLDKENLKDLLNSKQQNLQHKNPWFYQCNIHKGPEYNTYLLLLNPKQDNEPNQDYSRHFGAIVVVPQGVNDATGQVYFTQEFQNKHGLEAGDAVRFLKHAAINFQLGVAADEQT